MSRTTPIIHGRADPVVPLETLLRLSSLIPKAQLLVFGACGHGTQTQRSARLVALFNAFLTETDAIPATT